MSWDLVSLHLIKYLTLEGIFKTIYGYHFPILNHFRHGKTIILPFYPLSSLDECIFDGAYQ